MTTINFKIETTTDTTELTNIVNYLEDIICEIMNNDLNKDNWMALKSCRECLTGIDKFRKSDCAYSMYVNAVAVQVWANSAINNIDNDLSI